MIDLAILRDDPTGLAAALERRGLDLDVPRMLELDQERRRVRAEAEAVRAEQRHLGRAISRLQGDERRAAIQKAGNLAARYKELIAAADRLDESFRTMWVRVPNLADPTAAHGLSEADGEEIHQWGDRRAFDFPVRDHQDLGVSLGAIDIERAAKVSGSRFGYLLGPAVLIQFSLVRMAFDLLGAKGFVPVVPPVLVREKALFGTGFFPDDEDQVYRLERDNLFLVGTSEVPLAGFHADEILSETDLPLRYAGYSSCFRREAGAHGQDTAGIFRVHQFDKVEMFSFCHPDRSREEHERLLAIEEDLVQRLEIPYRVVNVAAGDLGASASKKYDIEAWVPSQARYREITSCSNTTDFQSRRLRIRFRTSEGNRLVHTLNGTAVAVGRALIALLENHQQEDGSVIIPEALRAYTGFDRIG